MALNELNSKGVPTDWVIHTMGHELTALNAIDHARTIEEIASRFTHRGWLGISRTQESSFLLYKSLK